MEVTLRHGIEYEATAPVALDDLVKSLEANARLLRAAGDLLTAIVPGLEIETKKISAIAVTQGSPLK